MYGYKWTATETNSKFSKLQTPNSSTKWPYFCMDSCACWCSTGFNFRTFFLLIYINELTKDISSTGKLFADDTSIFSVVNDIYVSADQMNKDLEKISMWVYQWKMSFNPDISKQAQEITFSKKNKDVSHPPLYFNKNLVVVCSYQKHLGVFLDKKLNFQHYIKEKNAKASKGIVLLES